MNVVLQIGAMEDLVQKLQTQAHALRSVKNPRVQQIVGAVLHASPLLLTQLERAANELLSVTPPLFSEDVVA